MYWRDLSRVKIETCLIHSQRTRIHSPSHWHTHARRHSHTPPISHPHYDAYTHASAHTFRARNTPAECSQMSNITYLKGLWYTYDGFTLHKCIGHVSRIIGINESFCLLKSAGTYSYLYMQNTSDWYAITWASNFWTRTAMICEFYSHDIAFYAEACKLDC